MVGRVAVGITDRAMRVESRAARKLLGREVYSRVLQPALPRAGTQVERSDQNVCRTSVPEAFSRIGVLARIGDRVRDR